MSDEQDDEEFEWPEEELVSDEDWIREIAENMAIYAELARSQRKGEPPQLPPPSVRVGRDEEFIPAARELLNAFKKNRGSFTGPLCGTRKLGRLYTLEIAGQIARCVERVEDHHGKDP